MRINELTPLSMALGLALVVVTSGCGRGDETNVASAFDVYVPSATPVVNVSLGDVARTQIPVREAQVLDLGDNTTGQPNQFQIAAARSSGRVFAVDVYDGTLRGFDATDAPVIWPGTGTSQLDFEDAPLTIGANEDQLLLANAYPGRLRLLDADGQLVTDLYLETSPWKATGLGDATFVALQFETGVVGRYSLDGAEVARYTVFQFPEERLGGDQHLWAHHDFVVGRERVYATTADTHQVSAFAVDGKNVWVLDGDAERIPIPENISGKTLGRSRRAGRAAGATIDAEFAQMKWPEFYPALTKIATDADDRLYVFPYVIDRNADRYPVDIYEADGTSVARGWLPFQGWDAFSKGGVYRLETRNDRTVIVRYELDLSPPANSTAGQ
jgi:hypothetical protein